MYTIHVQPFLHNFQKILSDIPLNTFIHSNLGVKHFQILTINYNQVNNHPFKGR